MATFTSNKNVYQCGTKPCSKRWRWVGCAGWVWNSIVEWSVRAGCGWVYTYTRVKFCVVSGKLGYGGIITQSDIYIK